MHCLTSTTIFTDSTFNVENVSPFLLKMFELLESWKDSFAEHYRGVSLIPPSQLNEIDEKFKATHECCHACVKYYIDYHPEASWLHLTAWIHRCDLMSTRDIHEELKLVFEKLKQYLPPAGIKHYVVCIATYKIM